ncbi:MAG: hypothetical protein II669_05375, partial [Elusimicrobia bacterium]|nr:hypothetical protein [Elusimicrobiota bacterium]
ETTRELYEDEISKLVSEKYQFEFAASTKYLYILQNRKNKDILSDIVSREDVEPKFKLFALMYLSRMQREMKQEEIDNMNVAKEKIIIKFKEQLVYNSFNVSNNFDLRAYIMGVYLILQDEPLKKNIPEIVYNAFIINKSDKILANSDGYFARADLFSVIHELTHVIVSKPGFYSRLVLDTVDELISYITPNKFLSIVKLSSQAYFKLQDSYTIHQTNGTIDYVKMGKKLNVLYNLFSDRFGDRDLIQEEHVAPIAFLDLLFNAHRKIGKTVDWAELMEVIKNTDDEHLDQAYLFWLIIREYTEILAAKGKLSQQETRSLINEMEKMQLWTLLTFDIFQNIKNTDSETYKKILGNKSVISFEEKLLSNPAETKEQLERISDVIESKEQLSRNDILTLLIIDVISNVDYEQLINNFDGVIEGIINTVKVAAQVFDMQKGTYSISEYEKISEYVTDNYYMAQNPIVDVMDNIFEFISNSLDKFFFAKLLINQVYGIEDFSDIMKNKKLLIVNSKQQEEILKQRLQEKNEDEIKDLHIENMKIVTMEIVTKPVTSMRSDSVLDVQRGIKVRYDNKENKLIVYPKKDINITPEEIQLLIMQEYFAERSEDIVTGDVIAFAAETDTTLNDISNRLKTAYTASVTMANKEQRFDLSSKPVSNIVTSCKQEFAATGVKTFTVNQEQAKKFAAEIKSLQEQGFRFVISCKSDSIADITDYDGLVINAVAITNLDQAIKFMESIKKKVLT